MKTLLISLILLASVVACTPTVQVEAPKEPIEINLNVKIQHDIRVQVDDELKDLFEEDSDVF
ncbi:MAG: YnbE family lipoprotein [Gammaproteobacteria bacterium]